MSQVKLSLSTIVGFESYRLNGVRLTEKELGRGSYAVVLKLEYGEIKCAGKQIYPVLYEYTLPVLGALNEPKWL